MSGNPDIEIRPFSARKEYELMVDYFYQGDEAFLRGMGIDPNKLPARDQWLVHLLLDHDKPDNEKDRLYLLWSFRGEPVGHSSINKIVPENEAHIHLHLWKTELRKAGLGTEFVRRSTCYYFERFRLQRMVCEPFANNPAPNRVLEKLGFRFIRRYRTNPGVLTFDQDVNRYELERNLLFELTPARCSKAEKPRR